MSSELCREARGREAGDVKFAGDSLASVGRTTRQAGYGVPEDDWYANGGEAERFEAEPRDLHAPTGDTLKWLKSVVRGQFQYHAVPRVEDDVVDSETGRSAGRRHGLPR